MTISPHIQHSIDNLLRRGKSMQDINRILRAIRHVAPEKVQEFPAIRQYTRQRILELDEGARIEREIQSDKEWLE